MIGIRPDVLPGDFNLVADLVRSQTGMVFPRERRRMFEVSVTRLANRLHVPTIAQFVARLDADPALFDDLIDDITVGETYFLREPEQLRWIREALLDKWKVDPRRTPRRLWSAGCATGEEPYSLAALCHEAGIADQVSVRATDICHRSLERARSGRFRPWSMRSAPSEWIARHFATEGADSLIDPAIRAMVTFEHLNLATEPGRLAGRFDLILCRNVLIYFDTDTIRDVARRLLDSLTPDGWLVLGASDPPIWHDQRCEVMLTGAGLAYRRADSVRRRIPLAPVQPVVFPAPAVRSSVPDTTEGIAHVPSRDVLPHSNEDTTDTPAHWHQRICALVNTGDLDDARKSCALATTRHPLDGELAALEATVLLAAGQPRDAALAAERALYLDRELVAAHLTLASSLLASGKPTDGRRALRVAIRRLRAMPDDVEVRGSEGATAGRLLALAEARLQQALSGPRAP